MITFPTYMLASILLIASVFTSAMLGLIVMVRNSEKRTHRAFALLTANISLWAFGVLFIIHSTTPETVRLWVMLTFIVASFLPATFYQFISVFPFQRFNGNAYVLCFLYLCAFGLSFSVNTPWYIHDITLSENNPPLVSYGPVFHLYMIPVATAFLFISENLFRKWQQTVGLHKRQVQHVVMAFYFSTILATSTNVLAPAFGFGNLEWFGPGFMVVMMAGLAYAMVRYQLLDFWGMVSRTTVYACVTASVVAVFVGTITLVHWGFANTPYNTYLSAILAALLVALVIQPMKDYAQLLLDRIILHKRYDSKALMERISHNITQYVHLTDLFDYLSRELSTTIGVSRIRVLLLYGRDRDELVVEYSNKAEEITRIHKNHDFLVRHLQDNTENLVLEELLLSRITEKRVQLATHLADLDAYLLVPLRSTSGLLGFLSLGEKDTKEIYTAEDLALFSTLAGPLAGAIENTRLYTKLQQVNMHLERIMSSMRGGVVAVDVEGIITTVNEEAIEMLGEVKVGSHLETLEPRVASFLQQTLRKRQGIGDIEVVLGDVVHGAGITVAMSSSFLGTSGKDNIGAMVLLYNMSQIKRLEANVQRADRLNSIGTMAAGMAHEIKNPLQSIKTFTQLLLERYDDEDFRQTFAEVVPPEVQRIDTIVTRLLHFSRPKPVCFATHLLQKIIQDVMALLENQITKNSIEVVLEFEHEGMKIMADEQQLHQVFLNLMLNAIDAMKFHTRRKLLVQAKYDYTHYARMRNLPLFEEKCLSISVKDTGIGIPEVNLEHIFTPFFTTKDDGSGLGLSVVHRIIAEHEGEIEVRSVEGEGTEFTLTFPLHSNLSLAEDIKT